MLQRDGEWGRAARAAYEEKMSIESRNRHNERQRAMETMDLSKDPFFALDQYGRYLSISWTVNYFFIEKNINWYFLQQFIVQITICYWNIVFEENSFFSLFESIIEEENDI